MSNMVKAVSIICVTALIMFVLYFTVFSEQKQCEKTMTDYNGKYATEDCLRLRYPPN